MSAFRKLLDEAKALGCREIYFGVQLDKLAPENAETPDDAWRAGCLDAPSGPCSFAGRTGEEALRKLVAAVDRRSKVPA